jgi:hypothetical protein
MLLCLSLAEFPDFQGKNLVTVRTLSCDYLEAVQDVKLTYAIPELLGVVTDELADGSQPLLIHSPFPTQATERLKITLVEQSSISQLHCIPRRQRAEETGRLQQQKPFGLVK